MKPLYWFACAVLSFSSLAHGALGDRETSVESDRKILKATAKATATDAGAYRVHEMDAAGNSIREYVSNEGVVFAVTWRGTKRPDLTVLLGSYFVEYQKADQKRGKSMGRQPVSIKTTNMVVRHGGHMRDLRGRAYVPDLVPSGVNVETLP